MHAFTGKKYEDTLNLTAGFHGIDAPVTNKAQYGLMDVDSETGFLSLLTDSGDNKEDVNLWKGEDGEWDAIGAEIIRRFEEGEALKVTVLTLMGKSLVVEVTKDVDG